MTGRRVGLVSGGIAALAVGLWFSSPASPKATSPNRVPQLGERQILSIARAAAARAEDPRPTLIQHSEGTRASANLVASGDRVPGDQASYLIAERGHFVARDASRPQGASAPRGTVLTLLVDAKTARTTGFGIQRNYPDFAALGPVTTGLRATNASCANPNGPCYGAAASGVFGGTTSQHRRLNLQVGLRGSAVIALHFSVSYRCTRASGVSLRVGVYRLADPWRILDSGGHGFSDWFTGPINHDFHITGTFARDGRSLTGTLHSALSNQRLGRCDSGHLTYMARLAHPPVALPVAGAITLTQYHSITPGTTAARVVAQLGAPADRESFAPHGVVANPYPLNGGLVYVRRGHPHQQLGYVLRAGKVATLGK